MVRLKGEDGFVPKMKFEISIPYGAIKRKQWAQLNGEDTYFNSLWCD